MCTVLPHSCVHFMCTLLPHPAPVQVIRYYSECYEYCVTWQQHSIFKTLNRFYRSNVQLELPLVILSQQHTVFVFSILLFVNMVFKIINCIQSLCKRLQENKASVQWVNVQSHIHRHTFKRQTAIWNAVSRAEAQARVCFMNLYLPKFKLLCKMNRYNDTHLVIW